MKSLQHFLPSDQKPGNVHASTSLEFIRACEELRWIQAKSAPIRSETNGTAENTACRVREVISALSIQSGAFQKCGVWRKSNKMLLLSAK